MRSLSRPHRENSLHRDADRDSNARVSAVEEVIAVVLVTDIDIIGVIPVVRPVSRPGIDHAEPIARVLKAWETTDNQERLTANPEAMASTEVSSVPLFWDAEAEVPSTLLPVSMIRLPVSSTTILPRPLPFLRVPLLLDASRPLNLDTARLVLSTPRLIVRLALRLILTLPWLLLGMYLWRGLLMRILLMLGPGLLFTLAFLSGICRTDASEKNEQHSRTTDSKCLHR